MRIFAVISVIGPLVLIGAGPALANQPISPASFRLAADSTLPSDRETYAQMARDQVQAWDRKLHNLSESAVAEAKVAGDAAKNDLDAGWSKTEAASRQLEAASAEDWESAKASFETASRELADAWHKIHPNDK
jgi:hypothetical protein